MLTNPSNVFRTIFCPKTQITVQTMTNIVAIEDIGQLSSWMQAPT